MNVDVVLSIKMRVNPRLMHCVTLEDAIHGSYKSLKVCGKKTPKSFGFDLHRYGMLQMFLSVFCHCVSSLHICTITPQMAHLIRK